MYFLIKLVNITLVRNKSFFFLKKSQFKLNLNKVTQLKHTY